MSALTVWLLAGAVTAAFAGAAWWFSRELGSEGAMFLCVGLAALPLLGAVLWQANHDAHECEKHGGHMVDDDHLTPIMVFNGKTTTTTWVRGEHCEMPR